MISGIAAVGIYTASVVAAPFTGGASIALGLGLATLSGGLIKAVLNMPNQNLQVKNTIVLAKI